MFRRTVETIIAILLVMLASGRLVYGADEYEIYEEDYEVVEEEYEIVEEEVTVYEDTYTPFVTAEQMVSAMAAQIDAELGIYYYSGLGAAEFAARVGIVYSADGAYLNVQDMAALMMQYMRMRGLRTWWIEDPVKDLMSAGLLPVNKGEDGLVTNADVKDALANAVQKTWTF